MASSFTKGQVLCQVHSSQQYTSLKPQSDSFVKSSFHTLKRNPKMELSKPDLIKLLSYLEGELQARDIVIATLKCEKMKYMLKYGPPKTASLSDPVSALYRDNFAAQTSSADPLADYKAPSNPLEPLVAQQRKALVYMAKLFKETEMQHQKIIQDMLADAQRKREEIVLNGLVEDPTKAESEGSKQAEGEAKEPNDDKARLKQIVLLLLAERKKIVAKYVEERKRSEDLSQILAEEKSRVHAMAEGLEEESKKSLRMEAEMERQAAAFSVDELNLRASLAREEARAREAEAELERARTELAQLERQLSELAAPRQAASPAVAKVVQPTATVSSVPVAAPTTGVARGVPPAAPRGPAPRPRAPNGAPPRPLSARGLPPPVPPNKPVLPPKKDGFKPPDPSKLKPVKPVEAADSHPES